MSRAGNYFEEKVLSLFRGNQFTGFAKVYVTLSSQDPKEDGSTILEPQYQGFKRMPITFTSPAPLNDGIGIMNDAEIKFAEANVNGATCEYIALYDSATGGNMLVYSPIDGSGIKIEERKQPVLRVNEGKFWLTGNLTKQFQEMILNTFLGNNIQGFIPHMTLYSGDPENGGSELSGGNFKRMPVTFSSSSESANGQRTIVNTADVWFPEASKDLGAYNTEAVMSAASGGFCLTYTTGENDTYDRKDASWFEAGGIEISIN